MTQLATKISDSFPNDECYRIEDFSKEMGVSIPYVRHLMAHALKRRLIQNLTKREGIRVLYPDPMAKQFLDLYNQGSLTKFQRGSHKRPSNINGTSSLKHASLILQVPVFDEAVKDILLSQFGDEHKLTEFLKTKLTEVARPAMSRLQELEDEYAAKRKAIFSINS